MTPGLASALAALSLAACRGRPAPSAEHAPAAHPAAPVHELPAGRLRVDTLPYGRFGPVVVYREREHPARVVLFISGDDENARKEVGGLLEKAGFATIDLGGLKEGGKIQQFGGPLAGLNLIKLG